MHCNFIHLAKDLFYLYSIVDVTKHKGVFPPVFNRNYIYSCPFWRTMIPSISPCWSGLDPSDCPLFRPGEPSSLYLPDTLTIQLLSTLYTSEPKSKAPCLPAETLELLLCSFPYPSHCLSLLWFPWPYRNNHLWDLNQNMPLHGSSNTSMVPMAFLCTCLAPSFMSLHFSHVSTVFCVCLFVFSFPNVKIILCVDLAGTMCSDI